MFNANFSGAVTTEDFPRSSLLIVDLEEPEDILRRLVDSDKRVKTA